MSKDVEWKLRPERGVFAVEAEGRSVEVEEEENEGIGGICSLQGQPGIRHYAGHWNALVFCSCGKMWNGS